MLVAGRNQNCTLSLTLPALFPLSNSEAKASSASDADEMTLELATASGWQLPLTSIIRLNLAATNFHSMEALVHCPRAQNGDAIPVLKKAPRLANAVVGEQCNQEGGECLGCGPKHSKSCLIED